MSAPTAERRDLLRAVALLRRIERAYTCPIEHFDSGALVGALRETRAFLAALRLAAPRHSTPTERSA